MRFTKGLIFVVVVLAHLALARLLLRPERLPVGPGSGEVEPVSPVQESDTGPTVGDVGQHEQTAFRYSLAQLPATLGGKTKQCKAGVVVDWSAKVMLWRKAETTTLPIASLTKMMTVLLLMEDVERRPDISLGTRVQVTSSAAAVAGSQAYLDPRETFTLEELLKCVMIFSANDAAYLVGEFLGGGDVQAFIKRMNSKAGELRLRDTLFYNCHGLPIPKQKQQNRSHALGMAQLAGRLLEYEQVVRWSSTWLSYIRENTSKRFQLVNRNQLVNPVNGCPGVNGMKTGYTRAAGYCLAATCERQGRTVIAVVLGCSSQDARNELVRGLLDWAYTQPVTARQ